jgi:argininosuccinate lyase
MKDLSILLEMIQAQLTGVTNVINSATTSPENYDQSYLKGYQEATKEIYNLVEKINGHISKGK